QVSPVVDPSLALAVHGHLRPRLYDWLYSHVGLLCSGCNLRKPPGSRSENGRVSSSCQSRHLTPTESVPAPPWRVVSSDRRNADWFGHAARAVVKTSEGVRQPRIARGRLLSRSSIAASAAASCLVRSLPLGRYWRNRPLVFSFVPRSHGLAGGAK